MQKVLPIGNLGRDPEVKYSGQTTFRHSGHRLPHIVFAVAQVHHQQARTIGQR
jgi:single-stranded DNA-binding protein